MSNRAVDRYLHDEFMREEFACCECGYRRGEDHHPGIRCPSTGRCGSCGCDWPCAEHPAPAGKRTRLKKRSSSPDPHVKTIEEQP